jgi:hypothetical protein
VCRCNLLQGKHVTCVEIGLRGFGGPKACGKGAVGSQHGTGVEGSSHPCTKGCHPKSGPFYFYFNSNTSANNLLYSICCKYAFCAIHIFLLCMLKINLVTEVPNMHFILGPLSLVANSYYYSYACCTSY